MRLIFTFMLLSIVTFLHAQQPTVKGRVTDVKTNEAIAGSVVRTASGKGVAADSNGEFALQYQSTVDTLIVSMIGYKGVVRVLTSADNNTFLSIKLTAVENELKVVVVSAGKFEQDISEVTVSMEVIPENLVTDRNTVNVDEILQQTPGVSIVNKEPQIRGGSGFSFGAGSRVQILVDDIPVLSGDAGRPSWGFLTLPLPKRSCARRTDSTASIWMITPRVYSTEPTSSLGPVPWPLSCTCFMMSWITLDCVP